MANYEQNYWDSANAGQNPQQDFNFEMPDQFGQQLWEKIILFLEISN